MLNQQQLHAFAQKLQCTLPGIQAMQILTTDGLALLSDTAEQDEDRLSALSAMLFNAACQLAHSINRDETPKGVIISCDPSAYIVTRMTDDCMLGLQIPVEMGQPWLLQTVSGLISDHASHLRMAH